MYSAIDIAKLVIIWCAHYKIPITNLRLQKLLYFLQGEFYKRRNKRLIKEDFYAWQLGPVIPSVYIEYSIYSSACIPADNIKVSNIKPEDLRIIDDILRKYALVPTWSLVDLAHKQDPWKYNYQIFGDKSIIPYADITHFFGEENKT